MFIVKLTRLLTITLPVTLAYLIKVKLVTESLVIVVSLEVPVSFSVELTFAVFVNVPLVVTLTTTHKLTMSSLFKVLIFQMTISLPSTVEFSPVTLPPALTKTKPAGNISVMLILVAFEGPWLVTLIVKLTRSFTLTLPVTFAYLIKVRLFTGLTVISVPFVVSVMFSVELTLATFLNVPLVMTLTTTHLLAVVPLFNVEIFQKTVRFHDHKNHQ